MAEPKKSFPKKSFVSKKRNFCLKKGWDLVHTRAHLARSYCAEVFMSIIVYARIKDPQTSDNCSLNVPD